MPAPLLLLFDIDGTLVRRAADAHRDALLAAIEEVHGVQVPDDHGVDTGGRTDLEIARLILLRCGISAERHDARAEDLRAVACREYARRCPDDLSATVAPGVPELLAKLAADGTSVIALLTGNLEPIARLKLARAGIGHWFASEQGAFGSDHEDRAQLPAIARARAPFAGHPHPRERTVVIGDTPRDIACARADGVHVVAVATGPYPPEALTAADAVVETAAQIAGAIEAIAPAL